ncbi:hypothetical protein BJV74DRAFT_800210, partial [Russula compacta]
NCTTLFPPISTHISNSETDLDLTLIKFKGGVDSQRSTSLSRARDIAPIALKDFKLTANVLQIGYDRSQDADIIKLMKFEPEKKYPRYPPIFFPGLDLDLTLILRNPALPKFARGLLFGPKSLDENPTNLAKGVINGTLGRIWQITRVTPGFMSIAPTYLRFVLSPDKEFTSVGTTSGIEYENDFKDLKRFLITKADSSMVQGIIQLWEKTIFAGITSADRGGDEGDEEDDEDLNFENLATAVQELDLRENNIAGPSTERASLAMATIDTIIAVAAGPERPAQTNQATAEVATNEQNRASEGDPKVIEQPSGNSSRGRGKGKGRGPGLVNVFNSSVNWEPYAFKTV